MHVIANLLAMCVKVGATPVLYVIVIMSVFLKVVWKRLVSHFV